MSQATSLESEKPKSYEGIRLPIDGLIEWVANKVGGNKSREVVRFLKFACVGTLGAIIDLGISYVLIRAVFDPMIQIQFLTAATISFTVAVLSNFFWNRYWTYPDSRARPIQEQLTLFAIVSVIGWGGRTVWLSFMKPVFTNIATNMAVQFELAMDETTAAIVGGMTAIFIGIFVVMVWNFIVNRLWTFNDVD